MSDLFGSDAPVTAPKESDIPALIGHTAQQQTLVQLQLAQKIPHAFLFQGAKGIGKRLCAEHLARQLMCGLVSDAFMFDAQHPLFPQIVAGSTQNLVYIEPEDGKQSISIDTIRQAMSKLNLASDHNRVLIVDAAEQLTNEAANAILKNLEEPSQGVYFILICHNLSKLLPTIVSRCRQLRFTPLSDDDCTKLLTKTLPEEEISQLVRQAAGCPGQALFAKDQGLPSLELKLKGYLQDPRSVSTVTFTEQLQRKKQCPLALKTLTQMARNTLPLKAEIRAHIYTDLLKLQQDVATLNLTPQWALEKALRMLEIAQRKSQN